jgi:hypothetical protein
MNDVTIFAIIGAVGTISAIIFGYLGYNKGLKKDSYKEGDNDGTLKADIQYIKRRTDDVLLEQRSINTTLGTHSERITRVEESSKQAHKRIDRLERKGDDGE